MEARIRALERQLGRKTREVEILKDALVKSRVKNRPCLCGRRNRRVPDESGGHGIERISAPTSNPHPEVRAVSGPVPAPQRSIFSWRSGRGRLFRLAVAARYCFSFATADGTPLHTVAEIEVQGEVGLKRYAKNLNHLMLPEIRGFGRVR